MRQGRNLVSNSDFNRKRGEEYLKSSYGRFADGSNASVLISSSFASENIVGGGQLRSTKVNASSRSYKGGEGNYASLMSSDFADTKTMLNPDHIVGGAKSTGSVSFWNASRACVLGFVYSERGQAV